MAGFHADLAERRDCHFAAGLRSFGQGKGLAQRPYPFPTRLEAVVLHPDHRRRLDHCHPDRRRTGGRDYFCASRRRPLADRLDKQSRLYDGARRGGLDRRGLRLGECFHRHALLRARSPGGAMSVSNAGAPGGLTFWLCVVWLVVLATTAIGAGWLPLPDPLETDFLHRRVAADGGFLLPPPPLRPPPPPPSHAV